MANGHCGDCGTGLERNGVCPNCDEAAFIVDTQHEYLPEKVSEEFTDAAAKGHARAAKRNMEPS